VSVVSMLLPPRLVALAVSDNGGELHPPFSARPTPAPERPGPRPHAQGAPFRLRVQVLVFVIGLVLRRLLMVTLPTSLDDDLPPCLLRLWCPSADQQTDRGWRLARGKRAGSGSTDAWK